MGAVLQTSLPTRLKFSWDAKFLLRTDGKEDQVEFLAFVKIWQTFQSALPGPNSYKLFTRIQTICLNLQLYGLPKDLCACMTDEELCADGAISSVISRIYHQTLVW